MPDWRKPVLVAVLLSIGIAGMLSGSPIDRAPGVLVDHEPVQSATARTGFAHGAFELLPRASFEIEARVLSVERYRFDGGAKLAPLDFAVGWGPMSDSAVLEHFRITQGARYFTIYPDEEAIGLTAALHVSANIHLIPATAQIRDRLDEVRPGNVVQLRGLLVNASGPNHYEWRTSLTRSDTGDGACELFYVEEVESR
jgi:hypothetical protein